MLYVTSGIYLNHSIYYKSASRIRFASTRLHYFLTITAIWVSMILGPYEDGRLYGYIGDPNFSAANFILVIIFSYLLMDLSKVSYKKNLNFFFYITLIIIIICTQSRMAFFAVILYLITIWLAEKNMIIVKVLFLLVFLASIFVQPILFFIIDNLGSSNFNTENVLDRLMSLNDTSNLARIRYYYDSLAYFINSNLTDILFGNKNFSKEIFDIYGNIPHNWFVQSLISNGLIVTTLLSFVVLIAGFSLSSKVLPFIIIVIFMGGVLSLTPVYCGVLLASFLQNFIYFKSVPKQLNSI